MMRMSKMTLVLMLSGSLALGAAPVTAFAADNEGSFGTVAKKLLGGEPAVSEITLSETEVLNVLELLHKAQESEEEQMGPLTPQGNLTLVDDYGDKPVSGKQFITVRSKSGAVFYLIIDRDANGSETVHFLNQVDEADILAYMKEEEAEEYRKLQEELAQKKAEAQEALRESEEGKITQTPSEDQKQEVTGEKKIDPKKLLPLAGFGVFGIGYLVYALMSKKKKNKASSSAAKYEDEWDTEYDYRESNVVEDTSDEDEE